jgi:transposase-like protein
MGPRREDTAMYERTTSQGTPSIPTWVTLHTWLRERMQELVQWALEAEVRELLGRARYQRRAEVNGGRGTGGTCTGRVLRQMDRGATSAS